MVLPGQVDPRGSSPTSPSRGRALTPSTRGETERSSSSRGAAAISARGVNLGEAHGELLTNDHNSSSLYNADARENQGLGERENVQPPPNEAEYLADEPDDLEEIDLTHSRLFDLKRLGISRFTRLTTLCLRQNLFTKIPRSPYLPASLHEIDLYDNKIERISGLRHLQSLSSLDLSYNRIKKLPKNDSASTAHHEMPVSQTVRQAPASEGNLPQEDTILCNLNSNNNLDGYAVYEQSDHAYELPQSLQLLYLASNKISSMRGVSHLKNLRVLEIGDNKNTAIEYINELHSLEELWCGKNRITALPEFPSSMQNLRILSLQSNFIPKIEGLGALVNLEELYLSFNRLVFISGLDSLGKLKILDLCNNRISVLEGIENLTNLEDLWISHNLLDDWNALKSQTKYLSNLETIYLEGNPMSTKMARPEYLGLVKSIIPHVTKIDADYT